MIHWTFWKALRCSGCHTKSVSFFINCRRGWEVSATIRENRFRYLTIPIKVCITPRVCGEGMLVIDLILSSSAVSPSRVHVNHQNDVWSTLLVWVEQYIIVQCCVKDVEYVFIMPLFTFAINESIICNSTQTIKLSEYIFHSLLEHISTVGKSKWQPFPSVLSYGVLEVQRRLLSSSRFTFQNLLRASRMLKWEAPLTLGMTSFMVLTY